MDDGRKLKNHSLSTTLTTSNGKLTPKYKRAEIDWSQVPVIGYFLEEDSIYRAIQQPSGGQWIYTQAFIICSECHTAISGHGGPGHNSICLTCYETHKIKLFAEGKLIEDYTRTQR